MKKGIVPDKLVEDLEKSRLLLKEKKPIVYEKLMKYLEAEKNGDVFAMSLLDLAVGMQCNFSCPHCCAEALCEDSKGRQMSLSEIKRVADEAHSVGIFVISLIGGEPLIWKDLDKIVEAIGPKRFHISLTTNGWFLTKEMAANLAIWGVDKVGISVDSGFADQHDEFRKKKGSFERALKGLQNATNAGIRSIVSTCVTHQNIHTKGFQMLLDLVVQLKVGLDLQCATVSGGWRGAMDCLLDEQDAAFLEGLRQQYPLLRRDVWSTPGSEGGCPAVTRSVYIIPSGEVLPCLFIHLSLGNVFHEPLRNILERGVQIREFRDFTRLCLAGEDRKFISKYLEPTFGAKKLPLSYEDGFQKILNLNNDSDIEPVVTVTEGDHEKK